MSLGQQVREEGPKTHISKSGTPTFGGIIFILSTAMAVAATGIYSSEVLWGIYALLAFGLIGFIDDYVKVVKKTPYGLSGRWQVLLQIVFSLPFLLLNADVLPKAFGASSPIWLNIIFYLFIMVGTVNAVNLADGLDGLATGASTITLLFLVPIIFSVVPNATIVPLALAGGLIGFLFYNFKPAKVWMGNLGSNAIGGLLVVSGIYSGHIWIFAVGAGLFIIEALSSMIQVGYFKYTKYIAPIKKGIRIFKMSPIHHHFELSGWSEIKVVLVFWFASAIFGVWMYALYYILYAM
jgi:phospho-N-acetylmuramoyl-pentapeptide-transferase